MLMLLMLMLVLVLLVGWVGLGVDGQVDGRARHQLQKAGREREAPMSGCLYRWQATYLP